MPTAAFAIRRATKDDIPALVRLLRRSWLVTWAPEIPFYAVQAFAAHDPVPDVVKTRRQIMWVAFEGESIFGRVDVEKDRLENIEVDPALWRRGIGSKLLTHGESLIARYHSVASLEVRAFNLRVVDDASPASKRALAIASTAAVAVARAVEKADPELSEEVLRCVLNSLSAAGRSRER